MQFNFSFAMFCISIIALCSQFFNFKLNKKNYNDKNENIENSEISVTLNKEKEDSLSNKLPPTKIKNR